MPRISMKHEDAMMGGQFFQEGNIEILKSVCAVHQFPPSAKTGKQSDPFPCVRWTIAKLDDDWNKVEDEEQEVITIRLGTLDKIRPGNLDNPADMDAEPEDLGDAVDTEGNSVYGEPGAKVGGNWGAMEASLRKAGFKANVIERVYMPDFDGMKCHLKTVTTNRTYEDKTTGEKKQATELVCDKIHVYPYEAAKKGTAAKKGATSKPESKAKAEEDIIDEIKSVIAAPSDAFKKVIDGKEVNRGVFQLQVQMEFSRNKNPKAAQASNALKDDEKLAVLAAGMQELGIGFDVNLESGKVKVAY